MAIKTIEQPRRCLAALAELFVTEDGSWGWRVDCPLCLGEHIHSGGGLDKDPRTHLRRRNSHCCTIGEFTGLKAGSPEAKAAETLNLSLDDYSLVDSDSRHTAELMESLEIHGDDVCVGIALKEVGA